MIFIKLFFESFNFAFAALRENKLRTILSLLGITIGIMTIIGVFSAVDTLRNNLQSSVEKLGSTTIYIQKWPWDGGPDFPWWKFVNRPSPNVRDYEKLVSRVENADGVSLQIYLPNRTIKYRNNSVEGAQIAAATHDYYKTTNFDFESGRYFTDAESRRGTPNAIIGSSISEALFPLGDAVGKTISVLGRRIAIVGVFKKEGEGLLIDVSADNTILLPLNFTRNVIDVESERYDPTIVVKGREDIPLNELESELKGLMRSIRRLSPRETDDFSLNKTTVITAQLDQLFGIVNFAGAFIGGFSILVGGFGIANIMFVSVKERTNIIGIQKSLGAKNYFILFQFLFEAVLLCLMGGAIGLGIVYLLAFLFKTFADFNVIVDIGKVFLTVFLSTAIGLISGFIPAFMASRLDPVEAIRSK